MHPFIYSLHICNELIKALTGGKMFVNSCVKYQIYLYILIHSFICLVDQMHTVQNAFECVPLPQPPPRNKLIFFCSLHCRILPYPFYVSHLSCLLHAVPREKKTRLATDFLLPPPLRYICSLSGGGGRRGWGWGWWCWGSGERLRGQCWGPDESPVQ